MYNEFENNMHVIEQLQNKGIIMMYLIILFWLIVSLFSCLLQNRRYKSWAHLSVIGGVYVSVSEPAWVWFWVSMSSLYCEVRAPEGVSLCLPANQILCLSSYVFTSVDT